MQIGKKNEISSQFFTLRKIHSPKPRAVDDYTFRSFQFGALGFFLQFVAQIHSSVLTGCAYLRPSTATSEIIVAMAPMKIPVVCEKLTFFEN